MILGQIAYVDCFVFLIFLIPQLLLRVHFIDLLEVAFKALPFLCASTYKSQINNDCGNPDMKIVIRLPYAFLNEHLFVTKVERSPFVQQATLFEDFVIRIVRYAFAKIPASIGISRAFEAVRNVLNHCMQAVCSFRRL